MKRQHSLLLSVMGLTLGACSSVPDAPEYYTDAQQQKFEYRAEQAIQSLDRTPDWFHEQDSDEQLTANATARSLDMQMALDKATLDAKRILAEKLSGRLSGKIRMYVEENNITDVFNEESSKVVMSTFNEVQLSGSQLTEHEVINEADGYRAYVQIQMPQTAANNVMTAHLRTKAATSFDSRVKAAYEKLEADIKAMGK